MCLISLFSWSVAKLSLFAEMVGLLAVVGSSVRYFPTSSKRVEGIAAKALNEGVANTVLLDNCWDRKSDVEYVGLTQVAEVPPKHVYVRGAKVSPTLEGVDSPEKWNKLYDCGYTVMKKAP